MDDVEVVEEDDNGEGQEDDSNADAVSHATLFGGGGKAALLRGGGASLRLDQPALGDSDTAASDFRTSIRQFSIKIISF